jgi:AraC-like DNA-binding protein
MQIPPAPILTEIIKHYLFLDSKGFAPKNLRLFSDGNTGIVFTKNNNLALDYDKSKLPNSFLYGQITQFKNILLTDETALIIVVFQPTGIKKLLGIPAVELRDNIINLEDILDEKSLEIEEKLAIASTIEEKSDILNLFFTSIAVKSKNEKEQTVTSSINFIFKNKGVVTNSQLIKFTGYTERHIERLFMDSIGLNPKQFSNIIKLNCFLQQLKNKSNYTNLTEIAYNVGYADQSHLIKEFKKITGLTPTTYENIPNKLAINFLVLPKG